jgi:hypothetical protein
VTSLYGLQNEVGTNKSRASSHQQYSWLHCSSSLASTRSYS